MTTKDSEDLVTSLKKMEKIDISSEKPQLQISTKKDDKAQAQEKKGFDIEFQELLSRHLDREAALRHGYKTAFSLIMNKFCTSTMQRRVEEHPKFTQEIEDDPIALLEALKELMHDTV
jgi:hypothetical protein